MLVNFLCFGTWAHEARSIFNLRRTLLSLIANTKNKLKQQTKHEMNEHKLNSRKRMRSDEALHDISENFVIKSSQVLLSLIAKNKEKKQNTFKIVIAIKYR